MRIAVISDTHDLFPADLPDRLRGADEIWHLGDVCAPSTLAVFQALGCPLQVVQGNCDPHPWPTHLRLKRGGVSFYLIHIPPQKPVPRAAAILHGHTHVPRDEQIGKVRWLNPGCITRPRGQGRSFAWLTVADGAFTWEPIRLTAD
jgi:putative phosphoesterase